MFDRIRMCRRSFIAATAGLVCSGSSKVWGGEDEPTGRIAFVRGDFGSANTRKIWIVNADGKGLRPLTDDAVDPGEDDPTWSPNGKLIAFNARRDGRQRIYFRDLEGRFERCLTEDLANAEDPAWSPDGGSIVFTAWTEDRKQSHIFVMSSDGSDQRQLTHGMGYHDWMPSWAGKNVIVFESTRDGNRELYRINVDGSGLSRITKHPATDHSPEGTRDGSKIAFMTGRNNKNAEICTMTLNGTGLYNVTKDPARDSEPTWSPDGKWIAFTRVSGEAEVMDIWIAKIDGSEQRNITRSPEGLDNFAPSWGF